MSGSKPVGDGIVNFFFQNLLEKSPVKNPKNEPVKKLWKKAQESLMENNDQLLKICEDLEKSKNNFKIDQTLPLKKAESDTSKLLNILQDTSAKEKAHEFLKKEGVEVVLDETQAVEALKGNVGTNSPLREAAAKILMKNRDVYEGDGLIVIKRKHKTGEEKIQVFHVAGKDRVELAEGGFNKIYKIREEVFGKSYKDKAAIYREGLPDKAVESDAPILEWIEKDSGGTMPEGIRKQYKVEGKAVDGKIMKFYDGGKKSLDDKQAFRALKGPMNALLYFKKKGIAHIDLKVENLLLENGKAVVTDFDRVRIFPDFDENTQDKQQTAQVILKYLGPNEKIAFTGLNQNVKEVAQYKSYMAIIRPALEALSRGETLSIKELIAFYSNYNKMKICLEKLQVAQMGMIVGRAVFDKAELEGCYTFEDYNGIKYAKFDFVKLEGLIKAKYGDGPLASDLLILMKGMLDPDPSQRFTAELANAWYEVVLPELEAFKQP